MQRVRISHPPTFDVMHGLHFGHAAPFAHAAATLPHLTPTLGINRVTLTPTRRHSINTAALHDTTGDK